MLGETRNPNLPSAIAAAVDGATLRVSNLFYQLRGTLQARFASFARTPPHAGPAGACVIPIVRYRDVPAAIEWLCRAFGMQVHRVVTDAKGVPRFAELTIGSGMLM